MDRIIIRELLLRAIIGINPEEREKRQDVLITLTLEADLCAAGGSDAIEDTVNYRSLTKEIIALVEGSAYYLVEKMAEEIARLCLSDPRVLAVEVLVEKPGALRFAKSVGVAIRRSREELP
jgi:dihydroneopterin aldolase/D-erythro-7,8-dihydroneopterin triphosphate epimerase